MRRARRRKQALKCRGEENVHVSDRRCTIRMRSIGFYRLFSAIHAPALYSRIGTEIGWGTEKVGLKFIVASECNEKTQK